MAPVADTPEKVEKIMADQAVANQQLEDGWTRVKEEYGETWAPEDRGEQLTGTYESVKEIEQENPEGGTRMVKIYTIRNSDGTARAVWGSYNIDDGMEDVPVGSLVRITYVGKVEIKGGRSVKEYRIDYKAS